MSPARVMQAGRNPWLTLFITTRVAAIALAVALLVFHTVTDNDLALAAIGTGWGVFTIAAAWLWPALQRAPLAWGVDLAAALALIAVSGEWRSPFYVFGLAALVFPATFLPLRQALVLGALFTLAYLGVAVGTGLDYEQLRYTTRLESLATHLMIPMIVVLALSYGSSLVGERERSAALALQAERRRIAWELHDSAKQRVHAAHLVLSSLRRGLDDEHLGQAVDQAIAELRGATADMDTSLRELRTPLEGRGLEDAVRRRAAELASAGSVPIEVRGSVPELPTTVAAHAFRVAGEAMANAVRHAQAGRVEVDLEGDERHLSVTVADDGRGMPERIRPGTHGLRSMSARAETLGAELRVGPGPGGRGTVVRLEVPLGNGGGPS